MIYMLQHFTQCHFVTTFGQAEVAMQRAMRQVMQAAMQQSEVCEVHPVDLSVY